MEWVKVMELLREAKASQEVNRVKEIIKIIQDDEETDPKVLEAIQSGLNPEMFKKVYG